MRTIVLVLPLAAAAVLAGCGSSSKTAQDVLSSPPPFGSTPTITVTVPPSTTAPATSPAPTGPAACTTAHLAVSLGSGNGAAGSTYYPLHFVNKGSASCTITGYPGVSFVAPQGGTQVGAAAKRSAGATPTVTLAPGGEATATVQIAATVNYTPSDCDPTAVSGLRVYPPANTAAAYVPFPSSLRNFQACSKDTGQTAGSSQLIIRPVKAGTTGI